jgi:flagellar biosynthesis protein FliQ
MSVSAIVAAVHGMLVMTLLIVSPFLLAAVLSSFVVGLLQAASRINDLTLSFIPRFVTVMLVIYFSASWFAAQIVSYIERSAIAMRGILG